MTHFFFWRPYRNVIRIPLSIYFLLKRQMEEPGIRHTYTFPTRSSAPGGGARDQSKHYVSFSYTSERTKWRSKEPAPNSLVQHLRAHQVEEPRISQTCTPPTFPSAPSGGARDQPKLHFSNTSERTRWRSQNSVKPFICPTPPSAPGGGARNQPKRYLSNTSERTRWRSHLSKTSLSQHLRAHQVLRAHQWRNQISAKPTSFQQLRAHQVEEPEFSQTLYFSDTSECTRWRSQNSAKRAHQVEEPEFRQHLYFSNTSVRTRWRSQNSANITLFQPLRAHQVEEPDLSPKLQCSNTSERTRWRSQNSAKTTLCQHLRAHQVEEPEMY